MGRDLGEHRCLALGDAQNVTVCLTSAVDSLTVVFVVTVSVDLVPGTVFAGRYRVLRRIAAGGMGAVFEVLHLETQRRRALKVMHATLFQSEELRERFRREATVAAHVDSEFIVDVFDAGIDEATEMPFLVMELLRGEELGERLKRLKRIEPDELLGYLHYVALALDKTHQASIIHRDLKPANVFLSEREEGGVRVKILDFGIAKIVAEGATTGGSTQSLGTPLYMAPEQFNPRSKLTNAVDIYALGMMAYTLLVGVPYWFEEARGGNVYAVVAVAIHGIPEPPSIRAAARNVQLSPAFDAWFARATALDPKARFAKASEAVRELSIALGKAAPRPSMASMGFEGTTSSVPQVAAISNVPMSTPVPVSTALPVSTPLPVAGAGATTRMGQVPESTTMSASTTLAKPSRSQPLWVYFAGGCAAAFVVGLAGFLGWRSSTTASATDIAAASSVKTNELADVKPAAPAVPTADAPMEVLPMPSQASTNAPAGETTPPVRTAAPTVARTSAPTPVRTSTPAPAPAPTTKKKSYTRE